jgi:hypothetical protein
MKTGVKTALLSVGVLSGAVVFVLALGAVGHVVFSRPDSPSTTHSQADDQTDVVDACQDSVKKMLKDPDSARFDSWTAWPKPGSPPAGMVYNPGDVYFTASGMVNAKNGFGEYGGNEPYLCDAVVTTSGTVRAQARAADKG